VSPGSAAKVRELLALHLEVPASDDAPLELNSFVVVDLVEALEDAFGIQITAAQVTPENFGSVARIAAMVGKVAK
jgi:acyl carrier protein